jgi:hypothetical protein
MDRANRLTCPKCGAGLRSVRGVRIGKQITCPRCAVAFSVRPEDAENAAQVNLSRLLLVLGAALLYLSGGAGLAIYCFSHNNPAPQAAPVQVTESGGGEQSSVEPPSPPPQPARRPTVLVEPAEQRKIDDAIARGVWWLKDHALAEGTWLTGGLPANGAPVSVGFASLPGLALLECGVPGSDPVVQKAADYVRQQAPQLGKSYDTYQRALALLFLDRLGESRDEELIQYLAVCLIAGQRADDGGWGYSCPTLDRTQTGDLVGRLRYGGTPLEQWAQTALKGGSFDPGRSDNSNTQFATLALWVARRHQVGIQASIARVEKRFRGTQMPSGPDPAGHNLNLDGSWVYTPQDGTNSSAWPTMTCAGLLGLAVAHGLSEDVQQRQQSPRNDPAIQRALEMLAREIDRPDEKRAPDLYFLWSVERVGVLYDLKRIGDKDWYSWGSKTLLSRQQPDGSWKDGSYYGNTPVLDTCFALLFLEQANLAKDLTLRLQPLDKK